MILWSNRYELLFNTPDVGSNPNTHILAFLHTVLCAAAHRKLRQRNEDRQCSPLLAPPCARGDCALAHIIAVWCGLAQTFRPGARVRMDPQRSHAPAVCEPPHSGAWPLYAFPTKWSAKCYAPPHSGSESAGAGDRLCLRLSSASGFAHRKNGDLRTFYGLVASSYRHEP